MMGNISQSKVQISKQRLKIEQEKMERDHKFQMEKLEVEKKKWEYFIYSTIIIMFVYKTIIITPIIYNYQVVSIEVLIFSYFM